MESRIGYRRGMGLGVAVSKGNWNGKPIEGEVVVIKDHALGAVPAVRVSW